MITIVNLVQLKPSKVNRLSDRDREGYLVMKASIAERGILIPLCVYPLSKGKYEIADGMERYRAALELHITEVPVQIVERD